MAEVLQIPRQPDGQSYYNSSASLLRRSPPSSSSLFLGSPPLSSSPKATFALHAEQIEHAPTSLPSSTSSSPQRSFTDLSQAPSYPSTPASSISLEAKYGGDLDFAFPSYDDVQFIHQDEDFDLEPPPSPKSLSNDEDSSTTTDITRSESPLPTPTVDDTAIRQEPSRHVDYLSHDWREEDIWSSWRHIVSQRKIYGQRSRLENASWRTWTKSKYHLRTISPETLNWLKESDVTWLYGPLQTAASHPITSHMSEQRSQLSKNNSFVQKKPILKKRSMSEVMLLRSISASSLLKQAAASLQAQQQRQPTRPIISRTISDSAPSTAPSEANSRDPVDYFSSRSSIDGAETPCDYGPKRHIRFDDKVEQCIAVEAKESQFDDDSDPESEPGSEDAEGSSYDSSSDDGVVMMKKASKKRRPGLRKRNSSMSDSASGRRTIETLPSTTLKYRTDSPDVPEQPPTPAFGRSWGAGKLSPSPSQETLRPSHPSRNFLINNEDDKDDVNIDSSWSFGASNPKSALGSPVERRDHADAIKGLRSLGYGPREGIEDLSPTGLRRTPSGSDFMQPYEEDEDDMVATGLFGQVSDLYNTARDIGHVIWNVGWRR